MAILLLSAATPDRANPVNVEGYKFTWRTTVESDVKQKGEAIQPPMAVQLAGSKMRLDPLEPSANPMWKNGGYIIMDAEANKLIMVSPKEKKAMSMDPAAMGSMLGAMGQSGLVKMEVNNVKLEVEDLGGGERMLGKATHRYRVTRSHDLAVRVMGMNRESHHESVTEVWLTGDFAGERAFEAFGRQFANRASSGGAMAKLMDAEKKVPQGFPMKTVMQSKETDAKGKVTTTTTTMEVMELVRAIIDASVFDVPPGYDIVDFGAQMKDAKSAMDESKIECEKDKGKGKCETPNGDSVAAAEQASKDGAKGGARKAIKGLFKKP